MTKLSSELKGKTEEEQLHVLNHVSHVDLKKEYVLLVNEGLSVDKLIRDIKKEDKAVPTKKAVKKATKKVVKEDKKDEEK